MSQVKLKNQKELNPCRQCGLLTYNGKNSLCNVCDPLKVKAKSSNKSSKSFELKKLKEEIRCKRTGTQLYSFAKARGKTIENTEEDNGSLIISFTDNSYLKIAGDNYGQGGYVYVIMPPEQKQKQDHFRWKGYECEKCHHQWLPRKKTTKAKRCPQCGSLKTNSLMSLSRRLNDETEI